MCRTEFSSQFEAEVDDNLAEKIKNAIPEEYDMRKEELRKLGKLEANQIKIKIAYGNDHKLIDDRYMDHLTSNRHQWTIFVRSKNPNV